MSHPPSLLNRDPSVLLVEDNPGDARLVEEALDNTQFTVGLQVVQDGEEALDIVYQRDEYTDGVRPELIFLDWRLPSMDGKDFLGTVREDPSLPPFPVIVLTGSQAEKEIREMYENHANACISKSSDPDDFLDAIGVTAEFWLSIARLPDIAASESGDAS